MDYLRNKGYEESSSRSANATENDETSSIERLVIQAVNGSTDAFGELYTLFVEKIYRYVFYHVSSKTLSEDITGEVFLKAWRAISSCRGKEGSFSSWLYRIAHNQVVDEMRRRKRRPSVELENTETIRDHKNSAEVYSEQQELLSVIDRLPPDQKRIIVLKFIEGLDNREIARITGKREGAIRALQMRALAALKKELSKGTENEDRPG